VCRLFVSRIVLRSSTVVLNPHLPLCTTSTQPAITSPMSGTNDRATVDATDSMDSKAQAENFTPANNARTSTHDESPISQCYGRTSKAPPTCDPSLKKEAKTTEELFQYAFTPGVPVTLSFVDDDRAPVSIPESSSSSACSSENNGERLSTPAEKQHKINKSMLLRTKSRQGRETQRWLTEADTHQRVRLVTGCVPILKGGRILFVSASRKPEWILPKGGWEQDESMEESAIREAYEEAGVLGTLGAALAPVQYETRKSKKRRREMAELLRKCNSPDEGIYDESMDALHNSTAPTKDAILEPQVPDAAIKVTPASHSILSDAVVNRIREAKPKMRSDETSSNASDSSSYSFVKMTLFPLYVSEVRDSWPESGRFRKIVGIDEAIEMLESREELRSALIEVKARGLHLTCETPMTVVQKD
jgi:8-oxo-dGTP pyrophosphatase MutT (NUDIX family)